MVRVWGCFCFCPKLDNGVNSDYLTISLYLCFLALTIRRTHGLLTLSQTIQSVERQSGNLSPGWKSSITAVSILWLTLLCIPLQTYSQPVIEIDNQDFELDIGAEFQNEFNFNISNSGDEELLWHSREQILSMPQPVGPERDEPGEEVGSFTWQRAGRNSLKAGICHDLATGYVILTSFQNSFYGVLDPDEGYAVVREWQSGQSLLGVTCLKGIIYAISAGQESFQRWDIAGNDLGSLNTGQFAPVTVTSSEEDELIYFMDFGASNVINVMTPEGEIVGRIRGGELFDDHPLGGIVWVDNHREGHLWYISRNNHHLFQLNVAAGVGDQDNLEVVQTFAIPDIINPHEFDGVSHDGKNLIVGIRGRSDYSVIDDGMGEQYWLVWEPKQGNLAPDEDAEVIATLNMRGMYTGVYEVEIHIYSNDPEFPEKVISILVNVYGVPDISVVWPAEAGFRNAIDYNAFNDEVWTGYESIVPLTFENIGTDYLDISEIFSQNEIFVPEIDNFLLSPGEERDVGVVFTAPEPQLFQDTLVIRSNDEDNGEIKIPIKGRAFDPPIIGVDTQNIELTPDANVVEYVLEIRNDGVSPLLWWSSIEAFPEPDPNDTGATEASVSPNLGVLESGERAQLTIQI